MKRFELLVETLEVGEVLISFESIFNDPDFQFMYLYSGDKVIMLIDKKRQLLKYKFTDVDTVFFTLTKKEVK